MPTPAILNALRLAAALEQLASGVRESPELFAEYTIARAGDGVTAGLLLVTGQSLPQAFAESVLNIAIQGPSCLSLSLGPVCVDSET